MGTFIAPDGQKARTQSQRRYVLFFLDGHGNWRVLRRSDQPHRLYADVNKLKNRGTPWFWGDTTDNTIKEQS